MSSNQTQIVLSAVCLFFICTLFAIIRVGSHGSHELVSPSLGEEINLPNGHAELTRPTLNNEIEPLVIDSISASKVVALSNSFYSDLHTQKTELQSKIVSLQNQAAILEATISDLSNETLELNNELLEKDLELVALKNYIASTTQTRVVYNFVDVPIGGDVSIYSKSRAKASPAEITESIADAGNPSQNSINDSEPQNNPSALAEEDLSDKYIDSLFTEMTEFLDES